MEPESSEVKSDDQKSGGGRAGDKEEQSERGEGQREAGVMTDRSRDRSDTSSSGGHAREARARRTRPRTRHRARARLARVSKNRAKQRIKNLMKKGVPKELRRRTPRMGRDSAQSIGSLQRNASISSNSFIFKQGCPRCGHLSCHRFS